MARSSCSTWRSLSVALSYTACPLAGGVRSCLGLAQPPVTLGYDTTASSCRRGAVRGGPTTDSRYRYCSGRSSRPFPACPMAGTPARSSASSQLTSWVSASRRWISAMRPCTSWRTVLPATLRPGIATCAFIVDTGAPWWAAWTISATPCLHWRPTGQVQRPCQKSTSPLGIRPISIDTSYGRGCLPCTSPSSSKWSSSGTTFSCRTLPPRNKSMPRAQGPESHKARKDAGGNHRGMGMNFQSNRAQTLYHKAPIAIIKRANSALAKPASVAGTRSGCRIGISAVGGAHTLEPGLRLRVCAGAALVRLQALDEARKHSGLRQQGPQEACGLAIGNEQRGEGFHIEITRHIGLVLDVHPDEAHAGVSRGQRIEKRPVIAAGAAPVGAQAHHPPAAGRGWAGRIGQRDRAFHRLSSCQGLRASRAR